MFSTAKHMLYGGDAVATGDGVPYVA